MTTSEKRAREEKRDRRARDKEQRRLEKRNAAPRGPEIVSASDIVGNLRPIEEVMQSLQGGNPVQRSDHTDEAVRR